MLLKEPKFYFYDHTLAEASDDARLENIVACSLLKALHHFEDTTGQYTSLQYLRTKDGREIDFVISCNNQVTHLIEVKRSDDAPSKQFAYFSKQFPHAQKYQLVQHLKREKTYSNGLEIRTLASWLAKDLAHTFKT